MKKYSKIHLFIFITLFINSILFKYHEIMWLSIIQILLGFVGLGLSAYYHGHYVQNENSKELKDLSFRGFDVTPFFWMVQKVVDKYYGDVFGVNWFSLMFVFLIVYIGLVSIFSEVIKRSLSTNSHA